MKIDTQHEGCRFWGYEPASAEFLHSPMMDREEKRKLREKNHQERRTIRTAGYRPSQYGFRTKKEATRAAQALENRMNIEMWVFSHDYL